MNGNFFAEFIGKHFNTCFAKCGRKNDRRLFLMDNDPSQSSKAARKAMEKIEAKGGLLCLLLMWESNFAQSVSSAPTFSTRIVELKDFVDGNFECM
jgi:hypothetical protein